MNIVICHAGLSGYSAACWRELADRTDVCLSVFVPRCRNYYETDVINGLPVQVLESDVMANSAKVVKLVVEAKPDVIVISGWTFKAFNYLLICKALNGTRKLMAFDCSWDGHWRQLFSPIKLCKFVKRLDGVLVAGERGRQFARYVGFSADKIFTSTYGCDFKLFNMAVGRREKPWPRSFVYLGRYEQIKGLDTLVKAYEAYCKKVQDPWPLHCYGAGSMRAELLKSENIQIHDFVQPKDIPDVYARHGVYILPSLREPWGVSLAEAAAAGLPCICSDKVSSGIDIIRHLYDGLVFPSGNVEALARCLVWMHEHYEKLPIMGERATHYAEAYSAEAWADRILWACEK